MSKTASANGSFLGNCIYDQLLQRRPHFLYELSRAKDFSFVKAGLGTGKLCTVFWPDMLAIIRWRSMKPDILDSGFIDRLVNHGIPCLVTPPSLLPRNRPGQDRHPDAEPGLGSQRKGTRPSFTLRLEVVGQTSQNHELVQV